MRGISSATAILVAVLLPVFSLSTALADAPYVINYQGWLTNTDGTPIASGTYLMKFVIYDSDAGGAALWSSDFQSVEVTIGLFDIQLGTPPMTPLPDDLFATEEPRYLGITVGTDDEITPRTVITSASYSFHAIRSDTASLAADLAQKGAATGQALVWNGAQWSPDDVGDISAVHADQGLTGTAMQGDAHLNVGAGDGIQVTADEVAVEAAAFAGNGLTASGNDLNVGSGTGILVTTDAVELEAGYADGSAYDSRFVNENQPNSITNSMIVNGTIQFSDIGQNGASVGDLMRWNGSSWQPARQGFPAPDYNSGWFYLSPGSSTSLLHSLGGDVNDYFVEVQHKDIGGQGINLMFPGRDSFDAGYTATYGAYWEQLTTSNITIWRDAQNWTADSIRVRIWIVE